MVTIDVSIEDMSKLMGFDKTLSPEELDAEIAYAISEVDSEPEGPDENGHTKVAIDIKTSNRPDLWSAEGIARIVKGRYEHAGLPDLECQASGYEIIVDNGLKEIRPYIAAAVVRGLKLDDFLIKQMIQIQDKVDFSFGRRRKRSSIGIYNINMLEEQIKYTLVDRDFKFVPLQMESSMTVDEIFEKHPKGIEYNNILEAYNQVPMLVDSNDMVLSMPPIINSNDVGRVTEDTTDVLVETTGTTYDAVNVALLVVVQALRDRGGTVESVTIHYPDNYELEVDTTPQQEPLEFEFDPKDINDYLGTDYSDDDMIRFLSQRRNEAEKKNGKIVVKTPPWRKDILHWVDISEDIVIAANIDGLVPTEAQAVTSGKLDPSTEDENMVRSVLVGLQLIEVMNYTLTDRETLTSKVNRPDTWLSNKVVEISNPVNSNYSIVRPDLLPGLLNFASRNTHVEYPQRIFETGDCVVRENESVITLTKTSVLLIGANETYETILSIFDAKMRLLGLPYHLQESDSDVYITGRQASIICNNVVIGHLGEIHPQVLINFNLEVPASAYEIDLTLLPGLQFKRFITDNN